MIPKVNIYIETTFKNMAQNSGSSMYVVEFILASGAPETRQGTISWQQGKELQLILKAATEALSRLTKACEVTIYTNYRLLKTSVDREWVDAWRQQGWKKDQRNTVAACGRMESLRRGGGKAHALCGNRTLPQL